MPDSVVLVHAVVWLVSLVAVGALALPLAAALFNPLSGRGAGFSYGLGLAVVGLFSLWVGQLFFGPLTAMAAVVGLFCLSVVAWFRGAAPDWERYGEATAVMGIAYGIAVAIRALSPKVRIWAEGYLNFGLIKSLMRADRLPPADMWFAGEPVQYYYGGHMLVATWGELLGTPGRLMPNLAVPLVFAALVAGAYELGGAIANRRGVPRRLAGGLAALFLGFSGNQYASFRLLAWLLPNDPALGLWRALGLKVGDFGHVYTSFDATHFAWFPTDVPIYSVLVGSAHAHVFSQPWTLVVVALTYAYFRAPATARWQRRITLAAAIPIAGLVGFTNIWSGPTAAAMIGLGVVFAPAHPITLLPRRLEVELRTNSPRAAELGRYLGGTLATVVTFLGGLVAVAPFVVTTPTSRPIAFFPTRAGWGYFIVAYGWLLAAFALYLSPRFRTAVARDPRQIITAIAVGLLLVVAAVAWSFPALVLVVPLGLAAWLLLRWSLRQRVDPGEWDNPLERTWHGVGFEAILILAGAGLATIVEVSYVKDGAAVGRFNTAYKTYSQIWLLWTVAAGPILAAMIYESGSAALALIFDPFRRRERALRILRTVDWETVRSVMAGVLILSTVLYGGGVLLEGTTAAERSADGPSLDATAFVAEEHPAYHQAILYLDRQPGQPHIVEALPGPRAIGSFYANPVASLTGLPTVVGWSHVIDYHSEEAYTRRANHVLQIYEGDPITRAEMLLRYEVEFIVVGVYERQRYEVAPLEEDPALEALDFGPVTVYAVDREALADRVD